MKFAMVCHSLSKLYMFAFVISHKMRFIVFFLKCVVGRQNFWIFVGKIQKKGAILKGGERGEPPLDETLVQK